MKICPLCKGDKYIIRTHAHPQNTMKKDKCPVCGGTGEVHEELTSKAIIKLYKYHGNYSME